MHLKKRLEIKGHSGAIYSVDGYDDFVFTGSGDCFAAKWNLITGVQERFAIKAEKSIYKVKLLNSHKHFVIGTSSGAMHVIDLESKTEIKHFTQHKSAIFEITENQIKKQVYTSDADGNLAIWNSESWDLLLFLPLLTGKIRSVFVSPDGEKIYLACQNGDLKIFETTHFNEITSFSAHKLACNCICISPQNDLIFSGGKDGFLRIWDNQTFELKIEIPAHNFGIYDIQFLDDGKLFITASRDKSIKLWDSKSLKVIQKIERKDGGHSHAVNALYKKSELEFISVGDDKRIIYWELESSL
ncbi:MAG: WD40 repeat domain-containing protein [Flavobacteriia bacterium]|jgi:WD40 repeat protein